MTMRLVLPLLVLRRFAGHRTHLHLRRHRGPSKSVHLPTTQLVSPPTCVDPPQRLVFALQSLFRRQPTISRYPSGDFHQSSSCSIRPTASGYHFMHRNDLQPRATPLLRVIVETLQSVGP
ncbi:hypothetical protein EV401DRAFT_1002939 [Pisolithus croceorrhizus]|nr:hypothetical protein EV401DRAFT_1002939 [Pisolithus croceorrhizus]